MTRTLSLDGHANEPHFYIDIVDRNILRIVAILLIGLLLDPSALLAKHAFTKPVPPVISNGVKYSATGEGRAEYVLATDVATGKPLWKAEIFHTHQAVD